MLVLGFVSICSYMCTDTCVWVCAYEYRCLQGPESIVPLKMELWVLGTELRSSGSEAHAISPAPLSASRMKTECDKPLHVPAVIASTP